MSKQQLTKKCEFNGVEFTTFNPKQKYCSDSCKTQAYLQRKEIEQKKANEARIKFEINEKERIADEEKKIQISQIVAGLAKKRMETEKKLEDERLTKAADKQKSLETKESLKNLNQYLEELKIREERTRRQLGTGLLLLGAGILAYCFFSKPDDNNSKPEEPPKPIATPDNDTSIPSIKTSSTTPGIQSGGLLPYGRQTSL